MTFHNLTDPPMECFRANGYSSLYVKVSVSSEVDSQQINVCFLINNCFILPAILS